MRQSVEVDPELLDLDASYYSRLILPWSHQILMWDQSTLEKYLIVQTNVCHIENHLRRRCYQGHIRHPAAVVTLYNEQDQDPSFVRFPNASRSDYSDCIQGDTGIARSSTLRNYT